MAAVIPSEGQEWISQKILDNNTGEKAYHVALGDGTSSPTENDTELENEIYRADDDDPNCTVETTTNVGNIVARISVSGGGEITNPPQDITELGLFVDDGTTMLYRETRGAVTVNSGDTQTFEFTIGVRDG